MAAFQKKDATTAKPYLTMIGDKIASGQKVKFFNKSDELTSFSGEKDGSDEEKKIIESSYKLYDWIQKNNINIRLASDVSPIDERFERVKNLESI